MTSSPRPDPSESLRRVRADLANERFARELLDLSLDGELLLLDLGVAYEVRGRELFARCPSPEHPDTHASWSFRNSPGADRHGLHSCLSCGYAGNAVDLVRAVRHLDAPAAFEYLLNLFEIDVGASEETRYDLAIRRRAVPVPRRLKTLRVEGERPDRLPAGARRVEALETDECWRYLRDRRGFLAADLETYEVYGHVPARNRRWTRRVILPLRVDGALRAYYGRSIDPRCPKPLKGLYPRGKGALTGLLGGWDLRTGAGTVVLTEGRFDEIYVRRHLPPDLPADVLAVLGGQLPLDRVTLLRGYREVIVLGDGDAGGAALAAAVLRRLKWSAAVYAPELPPGLDPDELPPADLAALLRGYRNCRAGRPAPVTRVVYSVPLRRRSVDGRGAGE